MTDRLKTLADQYQALDWERAAAVKAMDVIKKERLAMEEEFCKLNLWYHHLQRKSRDSGDIHRSILQRQLAVAREFQRCAQLLPPETPPVPFAAAPVSSQAMQKWGHAWLSDLFDCFWAKDRSSLPFWRLHFKSQSALCDRQLPLPPPPPPPAASVTFQPRMPPLVPPGLIFYNIKDLHPRAVISTLAIDTTAVSQPPSQSLQQLSDNWSSAFDTLERAARIHARLAFQNVDSVDSHRFCAKKAKYAARLADRVLDWLADPNRDADLHKRVMKHCGTPDEHRYEQDGVEYDRLDYLAFAANKAARTLQGVLCVAPEMQIVLVDQGRAVWNPKCMASYHHSDPDRDPSVADAPVVRRWVWPGWREPGSGNIIFKPKVCTECVVAVVDGEKGERQLCRKLPPVPVDADV